MNRIETRALLYMEPITDEERRRDAELETLCQITEEDLDYWDRLADRVLAEFEAEGGGAPMEEFFGMPASDDLTSGRTSCGPHKRNGNGNAQLRGRSHRN
jgi:hypothetical protein